ncbi:hypothetical protein [Rathayibacter rathayi]|uniref:hypothetical protein n=1 Tax=Rathayibacter rathayi TaxID=33887 RepID=UPI0011B0C17A|nr:hypothetical protein [Rathayibacter rathayi]
MSNETSFERLSEIQDEILGFTMQQVGDKVDKFYVQGKITDDARGNITGYEGNLRNVVVGGGVLDVSDVLGDAGFDESCGFIQPRIVELHDILRELQGKWLFAVEGVVVRVWGRRVVAGSGVEVFR